MKKENIDNAFIQYASDILADTNLGLSGSKIVMNASLPYSRQRSQMIYMISSYSARLRGILALRASK